ncbi:MAG: hypothetical protein JXQ83_13280, partial [Candidatus Glassbacteria bacterium]|nr:hypothetical protein [Candidatus Glassbacteria bacterium]
EAGGQGAARPAGSSDLAALLPGAEVPGWRRSGEARLFLPDNLWEYIDGGAEGYLVYNFQAVATADYENEGAGLQAVVDIYQMADDLCGFGIYASERSYSARYIDIGAQGYLTENSLHLYQGPYYIKLTAFQEGEQVGGQLEALAVEILGRIGGKAEVPGELAVFPGDNLVANSERYLARDVLGQSDLKNGFTAEYQVGQNEFKLFFILHDDLSSAARSFESYRTFMEKYGENLQGHEDEDIRWFTADDSYYGRVVTEHTGKVVLGILGAPDVEVVNEYLRQMRQKLISMGKV